MALGDLWNRTLVYFGIAEEDEWDDDYAASEELERSYEGRRANVRRLAPRGREREFDDWTELTQQQREEPRTQLRRVDTPAAVGPAPASVHLVVPRSFNDAQQIADKDFLLTPRNVEVSAEERARLLERGGFFNQA
jgi:cell division inhibitor SepF